MRTRQLPRRSRAGHLRRGGGSGLGRHCWPGMQRVARSHRRFALATGCKRCRRGGKGPICHWRWSSSRRSCCGASRRIETFPRQGWVGRGCHMLLVAALLLLLRPPGILVPNDVLLARTEAVVGVAQAARFLIVSRRVRVGCIVGQASSATAPQHERRRRLWQCALQSTHGTLLLSGLYVRTLW